MTETCVTAVVILQLKKKKKGVGGGVAEHTIEVVYT